jgi:hypothetical protein
MIVLTKGETAQSLYVTLNEKRTLSSGYYLFVFTHTTTRDVVNKIYSFAQDESDYPERINVFPINTQSLFGSSPIGEWLYQVYEQASSTNTDVTGLTEVERGFMKLNPVTDFAFESYNETASYQVYEG